MKLKILDKPFSLTSRALFFGLSCHNQGGALGSRVVASYDFSRLLAFQSRNPHLQATYAWVILDGFFMLSEAYKHAFSLKSHPMHLFVVGDCGGIDDLQVASGRSDLSLLLGSEHLRGMIAKSLTAGPITRLRRHIPPSQFYESWDYIKDPADPISHSNARLFFAGNDGLRGIGAVFSAIEALDRLQEPGMDSKDYAEIVSRALSMDKPLNQIAVLILDYYNRLCDQIDARLPPALFTSQAGPALTQRNRCCKAVLFKSLFRYLVLSWLQFKNLAVIITNPRRNKSYYAHRGLARFLMLDFGGLNGFEEVYPRTLDCLLYGKEIVSLNDLSRRMFQSLCSGDLVQYSELSDLIEPSLLNRIADV